MARCLLCCAVSVLLVLGAAGRAVADPPTPLRASIKQAASAEAAAPTNLTATAAVARDIGSEGATPQMHLPEPIERVTTAPLAFVTRLISPDVTVTLPGLGNCAVKPKIGRDHFVLTITRRFDR